MKWLRFYIVPIVVVAVGGRVASALMSESARDTWLGWLFLVALIVIATWGTLAMVHYKNVIKGGQINATR